MTKLRLKMNESWPMAPTFMFHTLHTTGSVVSQTTQSSNLTKKIYSYLEEKVLLIIINILCVFLLKIFYSIISNVNLIG